MLLLFLSRKDEFLIDIFSGWSSSDDSSELDANELSSAFSILLMLNAEPFY